MKRQIIFLLLLLACSWSLSASEFYAGAKIGPSVSFVYGDDTDDIDPTAGMSFGLFGTYSPVKFFALQAEFNYELKGFSLNESVNAISIDSKQYLHYISFPVVAKGMFPVSIVTIQPYLGLNFSFLANAKYKATANTFTQTKNNKDTFQPFDMGVLLGVEAFFAITKHFFISADLRFELNFIKAVEDSNFYNGAFQILAGAGYKF